MKGPRAQHAALLGVVLAALGIASTPAVEASTTTWQENWGGGTSGWVDGAGQAFSCSTAGNVLHATRGCAAQAFSVKYWNQRMVVTATTKVRGQVAPNEDPRYFCGLALYQDGQIYAQAAVGSGICPTCRNKPNLIWWNNEVGGNYYGAGGTKIDLWHDFTVRWNPIGPSWSATIDGKARQTIAVPPLTAPLRVDLQGAPYSPNSECQFGPVTVTGELV